MKLEFEELYNALFDNADLYTSIVQLLSEHESGMTSKDIFQSLSSKSSNITKAIKNLEQVLGAVRKAERNMQERHYIPRTDVVTKVLGGEED